MMNKLDELEKLAKEATPGPWKYDWGNWDVESQDEQNYRLTVCDVVVGEGDREADGLFIAAANPETVLKLIAVARAAKLVQQSDFPLIQIDATCDNLDAMDEALKALED